MAWKLGSGGPRTGWPGGRGANLFGKGLRGDPLLSLAPEPFWVACEVPGRCDEARAWDHEPQMRFCC